MKKHMPLETKSIRLFTLILLPFIIGCGWDEHIETLIIGPYEVDCVGAFEQECYLEFNEENQEWHLFYEGIVGFDFEPGFIWTLKVSLHEREEGIQDVGKYEYRLVEILDKEPASVDERPPRKPETQYP